MEKEFQNDPNATWDLMTDGAWSHKGYTANMGWVLLMRKEPRKVVYAVFKAKKLTAERNIQGKKVTGEVCAWSDVFSSYQLLSVCLQCS